MHRPGVDYWTFGTATHAFQPVALSPGQPHLSHTADADHRVSSEDEMPQLKSTTALFTSQPLPPPPPSPPLLQKRADRGAAEDVDGRPAHASCQHLAHDGQPGQQPASRESESPCREAEVLRLEASLAQARVEHTNALAVAEATLQCERQLRTAAERHRHAAQAEGKQLRSAIRALLLQPSSSRGDAAAPSAAAVPAPLYEEARRLLLRCERALVELKALQLRATDAAGLELLRRYDIPVLDEIPPPWPPQTPPHTPPPPPPPPPHRGDDEPSRFSALARSGGDPSRAAPRKAAVTSSPPAAVEETPTGLEVSALTTVSPDTPHSPAPPAQLSIMSDTAGKTQEAHAGGGAGGADSRARRRRRLALLSPPVLSPQSDGKGGGAAQPWAGPMHEFAGPLAEAVTGAGAPPQRLTAAHLTPLSELELEDMIHDTDSLLRRLAEETATLATSQGLHTASDVAALCRRRGLDYVDATFPPVSETLGSGGGGGVGCCGYDPDRRTSYVVQWRRQGAAAPHDRRAELLTSAGIDPSALRCGRLGDAGVVAALAALAEAAGAVTSVLAATTGEDEENGVYVVWLCVAGWWTRVTVDAYLPFAVELGGAAALYGCSNAATDDLWAPVCEKALAKVFGGYGALRGLAAETALGCFTGGPVECWEWWRSRSDTALAEIEAAVNTSARGAGLVLLTTVPHSRLRDSSSRSAAATAAATRAAYERLGLRPDTSYRVLAVAAGADGEPMLLLRVWTHQQPVDGVEDGSASTASARMSGGSGVHHGRLKSPPSPTAADRSDACAWLSYRREVLPHFAGCHVCFDCRRYHDLRLSVQFHGSQPAIPAQLVRVRVLDRSGHRASTLSHCPTRLWIGLHQPYVSSSRSSSTAAGSAGGGGGGGAVDATGAWGLKMTLVGQEETPVPFGGGGGGGRVRPAYRSYLLSESFMGEPQTLPAVWMYLELDPVADAAAEAATATVPPNGGAACVAMEFFVVPQMMWVYGVDATDVDRSGGAALHPVCCHGVGAATGVSRSLWPHAESWAAHSPGKATTAVVAVLAEHRDSVLVDVVAAPEELRAAVYHDVLDRVDLYECSPVREEAGQSSAGLGAPRPHSRTGPTPHEARCQVNGRCMSAVAW
ncbi:Calpain family cysteine protease [Novymonas esmeraldas]|uniref:Calpain family cysteine protease n=1 Tax=Novymonas esmeraldas TaxID=1808958 RepID=A0AAW0F9N9_9TRYP